MGMETLKMSWISSKRSNLFPVLYNSLVASRSTAFIFEVFIFFFKKDVSIYDLCIYAFIYICIYICMDLHFTLFCFFCYKYAKAFDTF